MYGLVDGYRHLGHIKAAGTYLQNYMALHSQKTVI